MSLPKKATSARMFSLSNILTGLLAILVIAMLLFPDIKATMIRGLMKVGLFQPDIPALSEQPAGAPDPATGATLLQDVEGRRFPLSSLRGKVVVLNFWATWCPPCKAEMPSLDALCRKLQADTGIVILAVDADGNIRQSEVFLKTNGYAIPLAIPAGKIPEALFKGTLPTTVVLDKDGNIAMREKGGDGFCE